jgi:hypothetical protein
MKNSLSSEDQFWCNIMSFAELGIEDIKTHLNPNFRSSTIFPVYKTKGSSCYLSFLTYWIKKHGNKVVIIFTARKESGEIIEQEWMPITSYFAFKYDVSKFEYFSTSEKGFCGSIEVEVFSPKIPTFTFPAISLFYENKISSSIVHSCIRSYNTNETNSDYAIEFPQTGFDVILEDEKNNYISFMGGGKPTYNIKLSLKINNKIVTKNCKIANQSYAQLHLINIEKLFELKHKKTIAQIYITHNLDVFPRFYVCIIKLNNVPTLTHTFFDTSKINKKNKNINDITFRSTNSDNLKYFDSAVFLPVLSFCKFSTTLRTYGQNLEFDGNIRLRIFTQDGTLIYQRILSDKETSNFNKNYSFNVSQECELMNLNPNINYFLYLGFSGSRTNFPRRFKMGLNVSKRNSSLGTNICFAPLVQVDKTLDKPITSRWFPVGGATNIIGTIHLTNFEKKPEIKPIQISIEFTNTNKENLVRQVNLNPNQSILIDCNADTELKLFLNGEIGWCFVTAKTYCIDAYYFTTMHDQIGGDHAF